MRLCDEPSELQFTYPADATLWQQDEGDRDPHLRRLRHHREHRGPRRRSSGCRTTATARYPVCVAKTQYSFSTDPKLRGAPTGHVVDIREVRLAAGAGFVVMICGDVMTMPGLPAVPAAASIDVDEDGRIVGLF